VPPFQGLSPHVLNTQGSVATAASQPLLLHPGLFCCALSARSFYGSL